MKKIIYLLTLVIISSCQSSYLERIQDLESKYPNEMPVGELIQLSNNQMDCGSANFGLSFGHAEFGSEYFYTGLYRDSSGRIQTFKLPAKEVYFVESDTCMIFKTDIHDYIEELVPRTFKSESYRFIHYFVNSSLYITSNDTMHSYGIYRRPTVKICLPLESIQKYINITY